MGNIILKSNSLLLGLIIIVFTIMEVLIQNKILIQIMNIEKIKKIFTIQAIIFSIIRLVVPIPLYKLIETIVSIIVYKKQLNIGLEKSLLLVDLNLIGSTIITLLTIKIMSVDLENIINFIACSIISIIMYLMVYIGINKLKFTISIQEYLSNKSRKQLIQICSISIILMIIDKIVIYLSINEIPNIIYALNFIMLLVFDIVLIKTILDILQIEKDKNTINELEGNNDRLMKNYDNISSFKHDFQNIMQGMGGFITTKDLNGLQKMYKDIIGECQDIENNKSFSKDIINNPAIYNLINNKYLEAKKLDIKIKIESYIDFNTLKIKTYELCRILGILIDNAIEAAKECEDKTISIKFIKDSYNNRNLIVIENSCKNYLVDISKIKQKGFTTKKNKLFHGIGLWKVNQIVKKNENLRLYTSRDKLFKQQLEIYTWD